MVAETSLSTHTLAPQVPPAALTRPSPEGSPLPSQSSIPWTTSCRFGHGVDALTGRILGPAVSGFVPEAVTNQPGGSATLRETFHLCHDSASTTRTFSKDLLVGMQLDLATKGTGLMLPPLVVGGRYTSSALDDIRHSRNTFSLVLRSDVVHSAEVLYSTSYRLNSTAEAMLKAGSVEEFRARFGDCFISGYQRASRLEAVLKVTCRDSESRRKAISALGITLQGSSGDLAALADHAHKQLWDMFTFSAEVEMRTFAEHVSAEAVTSPEIVQNPSRLLQIWSLLCQKAGPQPVIAILQPYYLIEGIAEAVLPKYIPVPVEVFSTLDTLRSLLSSCSLRLAGLPIDAGGTTRKALLDTLDQLKRDAGNAVGSDHESSKALVSSARVLEEKVLLAAALHDLYETLRHRRTSQPEPPRSHVHDASEMRWDYGLSEAGAPIIVHTKEENVVARPSHLPWKRSFHSFRLRLDSSATSCRVIGLVIRSTNGNGCWKRLTPIILNGLRALELSFSSGLMRRGVWEVTVYYVDDATFANLARGVLEDS